MVLGIDLGSSNTVAATLSRDGSSLLIPDAFNKHQLSTPSVALIEDRQAFAGSFAENLFETLPNRQLISFFKRNFGTQVPVFFDTNQNAWFSESIAALLLKKIRYDADMYLPDGFSNCVITVPAHYNDIQRRSVLDAARLAGLELTALLEEPVAAALYYGSEGKNIDEEVILVYDFGGGTFDLTLMTKSGSKLSVIAKDGVNHLGGKEFDEIIRQEIVRTFEKTFMIPLPGDQWTTSRLQKISEQVKIEMNQRDTPEQFKKWIMAGREIFEVSFDPDSFTSKASALIAKTEAAIYRCLRSLGMDWSDVHKMVLTGGTSSSRLVHDFWKQKMLPGQKLVYHQPLSSVACGAAIYAASFSDGNRPAQINQIELSGVSTYNIGLIPEPDKNRRPDLLIHRNTPLPVSARKVYKTDVNKSFLLIELCQFWDLTEGIHTLGTLKIGPWVKGEIFNLEVRVENKSNGTIGLKVKNGDNGRDVKFEFQRLPSAHTYDFNQQKVLIDQIYLNNYL